MNLTSYTTIYSNNQKLTTETQVSFEEDQGRETELINLYPQATYQTIDGFGGAITESAAYMYSLMDPSQKKAMLEEYFGSKNMKYRFVRIPIDSCDFSLSHYEADGSEEDESFQSFSFQRVQQYILPMLDDAEKAYGGKLPIMLSPWSPPAYMKTNQERNHGGKLKRCYWQRWADYLCRYILEYQSRNYHVTMLTLQNEPKAVQTWDSCVYTAEEEKEFLRDYMWPALKKHGLSHIEIYIWDHNKERLLEWAETIIDEETRHMVAGLAFHWYSGDHFEALQIFKERFPGKKLVLSEACIEFSRFENENSMFNAQQYAHDIIGNLNAGMNLFLDWNLLLNEEGGPNHVNNFCDAPFLFHRDTHELEAGKLQAYIKHFSHFIPAGSIRIGLSRYSDQLEAVAFQTKEGISLVVLNRTAQLLPAYIRLSSRCARIHFPANSITSCLIR